MTTTTLRSIGEVAAELELPRWQLAYLIERGQVPGPSLQIAGRRLFDDDDVGQIREALAKRPCRTEKKHPQSG